MSKRPPSFLTKLRRLSFEDVLALSEALILVVLAAPTIRVSSFDRLGQLASLPIRRPATDGARRAALIERVGWAVEVAAKRSPFRAKCFECGLTAQLMLRRRGVDSTLHFGVAPLAAEGLKAHVWVIADDQDVSGGDVASLYAPLAVFPSVQPMPSSAHRSSRFFA